MTGRRSAYLVLAFGIAALYSVMFLLVSRGVVARAPGAMGAAVGFDLTVTAALATWLFGRKHLSRRAPLVVLALGFVAARLILPANAREGLSALRLAWGAAELALIVLVIARARRIRGRFRALRASGVAGLDALERALEPAIGGWTARLLASELGVMGYAFGGWRRAPVEDAQTFSMHRRKHQAVLVGVFLFLIAIESLILHVMIARFSVGAAWVASASSLWLALWLLGDLHALRLHPLRLAPDGVIVQVGIRWRVFVPYREIAEVAPAGDSRSGLRATVGRGADVRIVTRRPLEARGLFGRTCLFDALLLTVDRPDAFVSEVASRSSRRP
jgi:hypothetical protein